MGAVDLGSGKELGDVWLSGTCPFKHPCTVLQKKKILSTETTRFLLLYLAVTGVPCEVRSCISFPSFGLGSWEKKNPFIHAHARC